MAIQTLFVYLAPIFLFGSIPIWRVFFNLVTSSLQQGVTGQAIIIEYVEGGSLEEYLVQRYPSGMPEAEARRFLLQIASALQMLSERRIAHRDLKPANVMLTAWKNTDKLPDVKIADFGFAKVLDTNTQMMTSVVGSPLYMAPELLDGAQYTASVDMWSAGVIFMRLVSRNEKALFPVRNQDELRAYLQDPIKLAKDILDLDISEQGKTLLTRMLDLNSASRLTWEAFMDDDYVRPKGNKPAAPIVRDIPNWMIQVTSYESDERFEIGVNSALPVAAFRDTLEIRLNLDAGDAVMISPHCGMLTDGKVMNDYYSLKQRVDAKGNPLYCFVITQATLKKGFKPQHCKLKTVEAPSFDVTTFLGPLASTPPLSAALATMPLTELQEYVSNMMTDLKEYGDAQDWELKLAGLKLAVGAHMRHADELMAYAERLYADTVNLAAAKDRADVLASYAKMLHSSHQALISSFGPVRDTILKVSSYSDAFRPEVVAEVQEEASHIGLAPFGPPYNQVLRSDHTVAQLTNFWHNDQRLEDIRPIHESILRGELLFSASSDPEMVRVYGIIDMEYTGAAWDPTIPRPPDNENAPPLIIASGAINQHLTSFPRTEMLTYPFGKAKIAWEESSRAHHRLSGNVRLENEIVRMASDCSPYAPLPMETLITVITYLKSIVFHYGKVKDGVHAIETQRDALAHARSAYDRACVTPWLEVLKHRASFDRFEHLLRKEWTAEKLAKLVETSRSVHGELSLVQDFRDFVTEHQRRGLWTESINASAEETNKVFAKFLEEERQRRNAWLHSHRIDHHLDRFKQLMSPKHEFFFLLREGHLDMTVTKRGIVEYPRLERDDGAPWPQLPSRKEEKEDPEKTASRSSLSVHSSSASSASSASCSSSAASLATPSSSSSPYGSSSAHWVSPFAASPILPIRTLNADEVKTSSREAKLVAELERLRLELDRAHKANAQLAKRSANKRR